jgi:hemerythrin-like domain-containing protein
VWLGVWDKNEKAIAFYQKNGFEIVGEHPFVMGNDRQNDFIMKRELPNNQNTPALKGEKTMGKATADLRKEHDAILFVLKLLEKMTTTTEADKQAMLKTYGEVLYFLKIFVDKCHHGKEEVYLFKELVELGITEEGGPIGAMLKEHAEGRVLIAEMSDGLDAANKDSFDRAAAGYRNLLLRHIEKENTVLFEMADHLMDEPEQDAMFSKFEQFEEQVMGHGIHEQLHAMIDTWAEAFEVK